MHLKIIGTTLLAAAGVCGSAAVWSHTHTPRAAEAHSHSRKAQFSRRERGERGEHGESRFARDFEPRRRRGDAQAWDHRGR
jgi:hypothetical protein